MTGGNTEQSFDRKLLSILLAAREFAVSRGVTSASYRLVPSFHSQLHPDAVLFHFGFPEDWVELYDENAEFRRHDPIADFVISAGEPMSWQQAIDAQNLTDEQAAFVEAMRAHGVEHGMAVPVYGPQGREAYVTFSFGRKLREEDADVIAEITAYAVKLHNRIVQLTESTGDVAPTFSKREKEVLVWIARGKSNSDIATILGVSSATVGTYVRRIFGKLGVHNRMAATIKGLRYGIVRL